MQRLLISLLLALTAGPVWTDPAADREAMQAFYEKRFPSIPVEAHADGAYAMDAAKRAQWQEMEEFPPYEFTVDEGEALFSTPFGDGADYSDCFADEGAVKHTYPRFEGGEVVTLEMAVNQCRQAHGEAALAWDSEELMALVAYMAYASREETIDIEVPAEAKAAYERGKQYYFSRRGQLNFSCSHCHMQISGLKLRAEVLSASVGHVTHWPTYRFKWQEVGPLHRRFVECNEQVGAEGLPYQSQSYRELEYFLTVMSDGLPINGPASRK